MEITVSELNEDLEQEGESLKITQGGLYSAFPIPAYKILGVAGEHIAKDVLLCMVSHMGKGNRKVFPSITRMQKQTGRGRASVIQGVRTLEQFGFVKKHNIQKGKRKQSIYYLQDACWNHDRMNRDALAFAPVIGRCGCGAAVKLGEMGDGMYSYHHYGCGDVVTLLSTRGKTKLAVL
jgi:hypothetical protein